MVLLKIKFFLPVLSSASLDFILELLAFVLAQVSPNNGNNTLFNNTMARCMLCLFMVRKHFVCRRELLTGRLLNSETAVSSTSMFTTYYLIYNKILV